MKIAMLGCIEGVVNTKAEIYGFYSRQYSLSTAGKPRNKRARELRSARFSEERKELLIERREFRVAFSLVRFFWPFKRNEHVAFQRWVGNLLY